ncbi:MAG TPA: hypothetical protein VLI06_16270 [Solimonas sp.]|nr:hypothetical protein [Solimonas sp.]
MTSLLRDECGSHSGGRRRRPRRTTTLLLLLAMTPLGACAKQVKWEEEVPLNTGETIIVKRQVEYTLQGSAGNPLDIGWKPASGGSVMRFTWRDREYRFDRHGSPMVLTISSEGMPVLLAIAGIGWSAKNNYRCTVPNYVQFVPDESGQHWTWPPSVDSVFFNLKTNLLQKIPRPETPERRYRVEELDAINAAALARSPERKRIEPGYTGDLCNKRRGS